MAATNGDDILDGTTAADTINALAGNDTVDAKTRPTASGSGIDVVDGGTGVDTLVVNCAAETQSVQLGAGSSPSFTVRSSTGNFYVDAYNFEKVKFTGGSGADSISTGERGGTVNGGGGIDHWSANLGGLFSNVTFVLGTTTSIVAAGLTSITAIERLSLTTGSGDDTITGGAQADSINTGEGDDTIDAKTRPTGDAAIDVVDGGLDVDTLIVNAAAETQAVQFSVGSSPNFTVRSASGNFYLDAYNMEIIKIATGAGADTINTGGYGGTVDGNAGIDHWFADLSAQTAGIVFTLGTTTAIAAAGLTSILDIDRLSLTTGSGNDTITGGAQADSINTGVGDDTIDAKTRPAGSAAIDVVDGGAGIDTLIVNAATETQAVQFSVGSSPNFTVRSTSGNFYLDAYGMEIIKIATGAGADTINTGGYGGTVDGNAGIDHWLANLGALTAGVAFTLGTTTAIAAAGLTSILDIERLSLTTGSGNDTITGGAQADSINTGVGNDTIDAKTRPVGGAAIDVVDGGAGIDTLIVNAATETQAVQFSVGSSPNFTVRSASGNFYVDAYGMEIIKIATGAGADTINTGGYGGTVDGNAGIDHWFADLGAQTAGIAFTLGTTTAIAAAGLTSILDIDRLSLTTGSGNDTITGGAQADSINTGAGDDTIDAKTRPAGSAAIDVVDGGAGIDTLVVNAATETQAVQFGVGSSPNFTVRSASGNFYLDAYGMEIIKIATGAGADTINTGGYGGTVDGNAGIDHWLADLGALTAAVTFTLGTTTAIAAAGLTSILEIDRLSLTTGSGNDAITGGGQADSISTGAGNDTINAKTRPVGGAAIDIVDGGAGSDVLFVNASAETTGVQISASGSPSFAVRSTSGNFYIDAYNMERISVTSGNGADSIAGGNGADTITTNAGNDSLSGGGGNDSLSAGIGNDTLDGGEGNDTMNAGDGNDTLIGGRGVDVMTGGAGSDLFNYNRVTDSGVASGLMDTIVDFTSGADKIDLFAIDANNLGLDGNQAFLLIGSAAFHGVAGELRSEAGKFEADVNGDGVADIRVLFSNGATAVSGDFIL